MSNASSQATAYQPPSVFTEAVASVWAQRLGVLLAALFIHALFLMHIPLVSSENGAKAVGISGIEVGIKRLTLPPASAPAAPQPKKPEPKLEPKPEPKPTAKPKPEPKPQPKLQPKLQPVNKKLPPKAAPKPVAKPEPAPKPEPVPQPVAKSVPPQPTAAPSAPSASRSQQASNSPPPVAGGGNPKVRVKYVRKLAAWLERHKRYPTAARRRNQEGTVLLQFTIDQRGELQSYNLVRESEHPLLNDAVEKMIKKASPLPKVPNDLMGGQSNITFTVPVSFKMGRR